MLRNKRGRDSERPVHSDEEWSPLSTTGESPGKREKDFFCVRKKVLKKSVFIGISNLSSEDGSSVVYLCKREASTLHIA